MLRPGVVRTRMTGSLHPVDKAGHQRRLRPDHHEIGCLGIGKGHQPVQVIRPDIDTAAKPGHGVASGRDDQLLG